MEFETLFKNVGLVIGLFLSSVTLAKLVFDILILRKSKLKEDYIFAKEFFKELRETNELHPLVVERGYHVIAGDNTLTSKEIECVIELENPSSSLRDYVLAKHYMEYKDYPENKLAFKDKFSTNGSRRWRKWLYFSLYFILAMTALSPMFFASIVKASGYQWFILQIISGIVFGPLAYSSLEEFAKIYRGEKIIEKQDKNEQQTKCTRASQ